MKVTYKDYDGNQKEMELYEFVTKIKDSYDKGRELWKTQEGLETAISTLFDMCLKDCKIVK